MWLAHHGIKGQHWGVKNGPPYPIGSSNKTLFISGSSKTQNKESPYYLKKLPKEIRSEINSAMKDNKKIIVGDAPGIDRQVQDYLKKKHYKNVEVYGPSSIRYSANKKWKTNPVNSDEFNKGSDEWLRKKDILMTKVSTEGLAVILENGGSSATRDNVYRLIEQNKNVTIYELKSNKKIQKLTEKWFEFEDLDYKLGKIVEKEIPGYKNIGSSDEAFRAISKWRDTKEHDEETNRILNRLDELAKEI